MWFWRLALPAILPGIEYLLPPASNKKPPATMSRGACFLVEYAGVVNRAAEY
jgi:hypothetical protein